jgi:mono/diheme cytochrome c family protein
MHSSFYTLTARALSVAALIGAVACSSNTGENRSESQAVVSRTETAQSAENVSTPELALGKQVYQQYCLACHQSNGEGVPGLYPPVKDSEWVQGDKQRLIGVIVNGLEGPIEVRGETYNQAMPPHGFLSNQQIAGVSSYIRQNFGNDASAVTPDEVEAVRAAK